MLKKILKKILFIFNLKESIPLFFNFFKSEEVKTRKKIMYAVIILGYIGLPLDFIADFIPVVGLMDDITVLAFIIDRMRKNIQ